MAFVSVSLTDAPSDQVLLATAAGRASSLVNAFVRAAQRAAGHGDVATGPR
jgi:hypothetical protein